MSKLRRFAVPSLEAVAIGSELNLPDSEARHARVLRMQEGDEVELSDAAGRRATGRLALVDGHLTGVRIEAVFSIAEKLSSRVTLATAWPKGKRATFMIEKCAELGVSLIVPLRFERSVVIKDDESEGVVRLKRVAAEASKQSGRNDVMEIAPESLFTDFLIERRGLADSSITMLLDPRGEERMPEFSAGSDVAMIIGPEGGFTASEISAIEAQSISRVRIAEHVLRIETAAIAAAAIVRTRMNTV